MLPEQFCVRMKEMLGEEYAAFYASYDLPKYQALRIVLVANIRKKRLSMVWRLGQAGQKMNLKA